MDYDIIYRPNYYSKINFVIDLISMSDPCWRYVASFTVHILRPRPFPAK